MVYIATRALLRTPTARSRSAISIAKSCGLSSPWLLLRYAGSTRTQVRGRAAQAVVGLEHEQQRPRQTGQHLTNAREVALGVPAQAVRP